jgi:hypothetical protein
MREELNPDHQYGSAIALPSRRPDQGRPCGTALCRRRPGSKSRRIRSAPVRGFELRYDEPEMLAAPLPEGAYGQRAIYPLTEKLFSRDRKTVCDGSGESEQCRMFKEMNILSAHQSSNPICPATQSVSMVGFSGTDASAGLTARDGSVTTARSGLWRRDAEMIAPDRWQTRRNLEHELAGRCRRIDRLLIEVQVNGLATARTRDCQPPASGTPRTRYQGRSMPLRLSTSCCCGAQEAHQCARGCRVLRLSRDTGGIGNLLLQIGRQLADHIDAGDRSQFSDLLHADLRFAGR